MADIVSQRNIAAYLTSRITAFPATIVAGTGQNATAVVGSSVRRSLIGMPQSAALCIGYNANLAATKTLAFTAIKVQDSADNITFADFQTFADPGVVQTGAGTSMSLLQFPVNLAGARDYVRTSLVPTLSASTVDTVSVMAALVLSGEDRLPAAA